MFSHYFGNHLLAKKLISPAQLKDILASLDGVHVKLGMLAIEAGLMTAQQVGEVHTLQMTLDKRFGEIAVERGYMSPASLDGLLGRQHKRHLALSQALLDRKIFDFEQMEAALADFKAANSLTEAEFQAIKHNDVDAVVAAFFRRSELAPEFTAAVWAAGALSGGSVSELVQDYLALFVRNLVRFVDQGVVVTGSNCVSTHDFQWCVSQSIEGSLPLYTAITADEQSLTAIGGRFARMDLSGMLEMATDSLGELLNCHNGLFLSKLSNDGLDLELCAPVASRDRTLAAQNSLCVIPISLPAGSLQLVLTLGSPAVV